VNKTKRDVGSYFGWTGFAKLAVSLIDDGPLVAELAAVLSFFGILGPNAQTSCAQKILVIDQKFFQAGPGYAAEFELHLLGAALSLAALRDVLFSGAGGLYHLIDSAIATL
jgi:hypothetical protein